MLSPTAPLCLIEAVTSASKVKLWVESESGYLILYCLLKCSLFHAVLSQCIATRTQAMLYCSLVYFLYTRV